jgi:hypothetical protein
MPCDPIVSDEASWLVSSSKNANDRVPFQPSLPMVAPKHTPSASLFLSLHLSISKPAEQTMQNRYRTPDFRLTGCPSITMAGATSRPAAHLRRSPSEAAPIVLLNQTCQAAVRETLQDSSKYLTNIHFRLIQVTRSEEGRPWPPEYG